MREGGFTTLPALVRMFALSAALALAVGGCVPAGANRDPETLVAVESADATSFNPLFTNDTQSTIVQSLVLEPLVSFAPGFKPIPWLAASWQGTPDGMHWDVRLRRGVHWSDGAPFTSKDVVWTWKTMLDPATGFLYQGQFAYVKDVRADGPYAVHFDLSAPNATFITYALNAPILPEHVLGAIPDAQQRSTSFGQHPIGTGPYLLQSWQHDDRLVLVRNSHWWHGDVSIPRIEMRIVLNDQARVEAMEDGSADFYDGANSSDYLSLKRDAPYLRFVHVPTLYAGMIYLNEHVPGLDDNRVRQAMLYGWDRKDMIDGLFHGDDLIGTGILTPALADWYDPHVKQYRYDPQRANALLDEAGWHRGSDSIRVKDGRRLAFELMMPNGNVLGQDEAAEFQADMRALGIAISVEQLDFSTYLDRTNTSKFEMALGSWGGAVDPDQYTFLACSQTPPAGNNSMFYCNKRVDHDLVMGLRTVNESKRRAYYDDMQRVTAENLPVLWGTFGYYRAVFSPRVVVDTRSLSPDQYAWLNIWHWRLGP